MSVCVDARLFRLNLTTDCNVNCGCSLDVFDPVCGNDGFQYFSSCHAGCTQFINLNADPSDVPGRLVSSIVHIFISIVLHKVGLQETKEAFQSLSVSVSEESIYVSDEALSVSVFDGSYSVLSRNLFLFTTNLFLSCRCERLSVGAFPTLKVEMEMTREKGLSSLDSVEFIVHR